MQEIKELIKKVIHDLYHLDFDPELTPSPDNIDADYSTNAPMKLARDLHKPPMQIAEELENCLMQVGDRPRKGSQNSCINKIIGKEKVWQHPPKINVSAPGFLNLTLPDGYYYQKILDLNTNFRDNISSDAYSGQTIICEFSDPNPFKVLHVGHLYTSIVGDSISRLFEYAGAKVIRANFGGDVGLHVAKTMYVLRQKNPDELTIDDIAKCYVEGTALYDDDETAHQEITKLNKEIYQINSDGVSHRRVAELGGPTRSVSDVGEDARSGPVEINSEGADRRMSSSKGNPQNVLQSKNFGGRDDDKTRQAADLTELYWRGRELSYGYFNHFYDSIGVHFDKYYPESTVAGLGLEKVKEQLKNGVYEYSDGAVIFNGEKYGLHTRVFINKEGVPTYETKDVGLIFTKWQDYHFDKSVVITGNEQLDYMKVVLKSVEQYAPNLVEKTAHLTHGLVKLPGNVKMSSRKGNFLKAVDVLDMVSNELESEYHSTDNIVALAATKYAFLKYKMGGNIIFDPHESVKTTGNSGPYLLYSAVRAKKILAKAGDLKGSVPSQETIQDVALVHGTSAGDGPGREPKNVLRSRNFGEGEEPAEPAENGLINEGGNTGKGTLETINEHSLMKKILEYKMVLGEAVSEMAPHKVATYLYELAQTFSRFYETCPVAGSDREKERTVLTKVYLDTISHGLNILGISIPKSM